MHVSFLGIDIGKNSCSVVGVDDSGADHQGGSSGSQLMGNGLCPRPARDWQEAKRPDRGRHARVTARPPTHASPTVARMSSRPWKASVGRPAIPRRSGWTTSYVGKQTGNRPTGLPASATADAFIRLLQMVSTVNGIVPCHSKHRIHQQVVPWSSPSLRWDTCPGGRPEHYLQGRNRALTALAERGPSTWSPVVR
jgi:hypothetical protein